MNIVRQQSASEAKGLDGSEIAKLQRLRCSNVARDVDGTVGVDVEDLPPEIRVEDDTADADGVEWQSALRVWMEQRLNRGEAGILQEVTPQFEQILIESALRQTGGRRQDAARLLGWGRNTLSRKIKELGL